MDGLRSRLANLNLDQSAVSLALGAIVVVVIGVLVFNYFSRLNRPATPLAPSPQTSALTSQVPSKHVVEAGETLGVIAQKYYGSPDQWTRLCDVNKDALQGNCDRIPVGIELTVPQPEVAGIFSFASPVPFPTAPPEMSPIPSVMPVTGTVDNADTYTTVRGDTLCGVLIRFQGNCASLDQIARCNNISNPNLIHADNVLKLRC